MNGYQMIIDMLHEDCMPKERLLQYSIKLGELENASFLNGRYFERDGKGVQLPASARVDQSECDLFREQQIEFFRQMSRAEDERFEEWGD